MLSRIWVKVVDVLYWCWGLLLLKRTIPNDYSHVDYAFLHGLNDLMQRKVFMVLSLQNMLVIQPVGWWETHPILVECIWQTTCEFLGWWVIKTREFLVTKKLDSLFVLLSTLNSKPIIHTGLYNTYHFQKPLSREKIFYGRVLHTWCCLDTIRYWINIHMVWYNL